MFSDVALAILSFLFLGVGIKFWQRGSDLLTYGRKTDGTVVKNVPSTEVSTKDDRCYYPVVRFINDKEEVVIKQLSIGYHPPIKVGTAVPIIYDPEDPSLVEINSGFQLSILPKIFVGLGVFGVILAFLELLEITNVLQ